MTGGRAEHLTPEDEAWLLKLFASLKKWGHVEIVVGDAGGIDRMVRNLCKREYLPHRIFTADWNSAGRQAGPIRNGRMVDYALAHDHSLCVAFPGGPGTASCVRIAQKRGLTVLLPKNTYRQDELVT